MGNKNSKNRNFYTGLKVIREAYSFSFINRRFCVSSKAKEADFNIHLIPETKTTKKVSIVLLT